MNKISLQLLPSISFSFPRQPRRSMTSEAGLAASSRGPCSVAPLDGRAKADRRTGGNPTVDCRLCKRDQGSKKTVSRGEKDDTDGPQVESLGSHEDSQKRGDGS